jgi:hypothetical protein
VLQICMLGRDIYVRFPYLMLMFRLCVGLRVCDLVFIKTFLPGQNTGIKGKRNGHARICLLSIQTYNTCTNNTFVFQIIPRKQERTLGNTTYTSGHIKQKGHINITQYTFIHL